MRLALPTESSNVMILLQDPRDNHPWSDGVDEVINTCKTLEYLRSAFGKCTSGELNLLKNVSILDVRPMLPKKDWEQLTPRQRDGVQILLADAIKAWLDEYKVVLYMGKVSDDHVCPYHS
jgi:hypothetical protein